MPKTPAYPALGAFISHYLQTLWPELNNTEIAEEIRLLGLHNQMPEDRVRVDRTTVSRWKSGQIIPKTLHRGLLCGLFEYQFEGTGTEPTAIRLAFDYLVQDREILERWFDRDDVPELARPFLAAAYPEPGATQTGPEAPTRTEDRRGSDAPGPAGGRMNLTGLRDSSFRARRLDVRTGSDVNVTDSHGLQVDIEDVTLGGDHGPRGRDGTGLAEGDKG